MLISTAADKCTGAWGRYNYSTSNLRTRVRGGSDSRSQLGRWPSIGSDAHNRFGGTCPLLFTHVPHRHYGFAEATNSPNYIVECTSLLWIPPHYAHIGLVPHSRCSGRVVLIVFCCKGAECLTSCWTQHGTAGGPGGTAETFPRGGGLPHHPAVVCMPGILCCRIG